jgi:hypothetical protein
MSESYTVKEMGYTFNVMKDANMLSCDCIAVCQSKGYAELICKILNANSGDAPLLGSATNGELLAELNARCELNGTINYELLIATRRKSNE